MFVLTDALRTFAQIPEPEMRGPLLKGIAVTALAILALALSLGAFVSGLVDGFTLPWIGVSIGEAGGSAVGWAAGLGSLVAASFAFIPAAALAVGFFIDGVAGAVEAKHYPDAPPAGDRPLAVDLQLTAKYAALALLINLPMLPLYILFPPIPAAINGFLLGREYFDLAALRRETKAEAAALRRRARAATWIAGALFAFMATIPLLNLLAPVFGAGLMTHVYNRARVSRDRRSGARTAAPA